VRYILGFDSLGRYEIFAARSRPRGAVSFYLPDGKGGGEGRYSFSFSLF